MVSLWGEKRPDRTVVARLHAALVAASRCAFFYRDGAVPDTLDGRFELLILHLSLLLKRLRGADDRLAQALFEHTFAQLDLNLREMGVGDMGVGKRIRRMGEALLGRMAAYETPDPEALRAALIRNLFGTVTPAPHPSVTDSFVAYLDQSRRALAALPLTALQRGEISFPTFEQALQPI